MNRVALFGGTSEGRLLAGVLAEAGAAVSVFVATSYGEEQMQPSERVSIRSGRLDSGEMLELFKAESFACVVDATHPYAREVTTNLSAAADRAGLFYLRINRESSDYDGEIEAESAEAAARYLDRIDGNVLLTTGSNTIALFTSIENWRERVFARVLPDAEVIGKCIDLGFPRRNLICMQGPFTHEMNVATIKMYGITALVTKDSGKEGGFTEKLSAARECGIKLMVIRRLDDNNVGVSVEKALAIITDRLKLKGSMPSRLPRFPLFIPLEGKAVLVVGGGKVAARRTRVLLEFGATVRVIAPEIGMEMQEITNQEIADRVDWRPESYSRLDKGYALVIAATDDRDVNRQVGADAKALAIPVSVADRKEESTFWFPAIARGSGIVAGLVSEEGNHNAVKDAAITIRKALNDSV